MYEGWCGYLYHITVLPFFSSPWSPNYKSTNYMRTVCNPNSNTWGYCSYIFPLVDYYDSLVPELNFKLLWGKRKCWPFENSLAQEYWSGQPIHSPADLPNPGVEPGSPALQVYSLPAELPGKPLHPITQMSIKFHIDLSLVWCRI